MPRSAKADSHSPSPLAVLDRLPRLRIAVWGDFVADEFVGADIARVSREAPVLILKHRERQLVPGGGANAAANLAALGVRVALIGVVGDDEPGVRLRERFRSLGMNVTGLRTARGRITPTKTRILAGHTHTARQQVLRIDREPEPLPAAAQTELARTALAAARRASALLISDYGYGTVAPVAAAALRRRLPEPFPICVDARYQIADYRGLTAATPNEAELEAALGIAIGNRRSVLEKCGRRMQRRLACRYLLVTRGRDGMALFAAQQSVRHLAVYGSDQALDVTGAGDTVIAVFTAALAAGADGLTAARLANCAGGLVVMKRGTATLTVDELRVAAASL